MNRAGKGVAHWETDGLFREKLLATNFLEVLFETCERGTSCVRELVMLDFAIAVIKTIMVVYRAKNQVSFFLKVGAAEKCLNC